MRKVAVSSRRTRTSPPSMRTAHPAPDLPANHQHAPTRTTRRTTQPNRWQP
jgi:hypothetical protein